MNHLFPIFVKMHLQHTLLVGGGNVGLEKLEAILANSPEAHVTIVAPYFLPETLKLAQEAPFVKVEQRPFNYADLEGKDVAILATDQPDLHKAIYDYTRDRQLMLNVADTPHLCDFYLGSVVRKGNLKIAISTNGKSPTLAKRLRQMLTEALPDNLNEALDSLYELRNRLKGDFKYKVDELNKVTANLIEQK